MGELHKLQYGIRRGAQQEESTMKQSILARLAEGVVLGDGEYIVELEKRGYHVSADRRDAPRH